jgi:polysaccharide export outer membrane protein
MSTGDRKNLEETFGRWNSVLSTVTALKPFIASLILVLLAASGQIALAQTAAESTLPQKPLERRISDSATPSAQADQTYQLGSGDVLEIRVFNRPQLSRDTVRIDERGMIRMPLITEELQAACRTAGDLGREITTRYAKYLRNPQVDVFVKEYQSQPVSVIGAVNTPGRFQLRRPVRLLELLTFAGGPSEKGGRYVQVVHAAGLAQCESAGEAPVESGAGFEAYNVHETLRGDARANPYIRPGDTITLPEAEQVFVVGNVVRPMAISLKETTTVTQAIATAGGAMPDTKSDRVRIVRQTADGKKEIFIDLKAIASRRAEDVALQANDIVEVPTSGAMRFLRALGGIMGSSVARVPVRVIP